VSWTDANTNAYTAVTGSVNITVGFLAGIDVTGSATATPASPSSANLLSFPIQNIGNGVDTVQIPSDPTISVGGVVTITGYVYNSTNYATRALLNTALLSVQLAQNASLTVQVKYDVASNKGGVATTLTLTAASKRTPGTTDSQATIITPTQAYAVAVTPDGSAVSQLPSNGVQYTFNFTVTNNGNGSDSFSLVASHTASAITIVSVNGTAGSSATLSSVAAGGSPTVAVVYTVGNVAAGTTEDLKLTATSVGDNTKTDDGTANLTVVRPALSMAKAAYRDDQTTLLGGGDVVLPNEYIQYKVTITNNGAAAATVVQITDAMPAEVTYNTATGDLAGWTFGFASGTLTADLTGSLAPAASRYIWIRVRIK
jgi:uncharacterized repeat protein (TIGR01451 family)